MATLLFVSPAGQEPVAWPQALSLLGHTVLRASGGDQALRVPEADVVIVDARTDLAGGRAVCQLMDAAARQTPTLLLIEPAGLAVLTTEWAFTDFILADATPAEWQARLGLLASRAGQRTLHGGAIDIDEAGYIATVAGEPLDLTYTEFELLKYLVQHPGRVLTRELLLSDVWGYDYFGGTRTVDVHIRRLRAKLGPEHEACITTVRNVGYRFTPR